MTSRSDGFFGHEPRALSGSRSTTDLGFRALEPGSRGPSLPYPSHETGLEPPCVKTRRGFNREPGRNGTGPRTGAGPEPGQTTKKGDA